MTSQIRTLAVLTQDGYTFQDLYGNHPVIHCDDKKDLVTIEKAIYNKDTIGKCGFTVSDEIKELLIRQNRSNLAKGKARYVYNK